MLEIEYDKQQMDVYYEQGEICFMVTLNWWWDDYSRDRIFDNEWVTIDFDIVEAKWWKEDVDGMNKIKPTILYKEWIAEQIELMRRNEGFLFDDMRERIEEIHQDRYEDYGI
jgi:hypothetical protein